MSTHSGTWDTGETLMWYANDEVLYLSLQGIVNVFHDAPLTCERMVSQEVATFMEGQEYFKVDLDEVDWDEVIESIKEDLGIVVDDEEEQDRLSDAVLTAVGEYLTAGYGGIEDIVRQYVEAWEE